MLFRSFKIASIVNDKGLLQLAQQKAEQIVERDLHLEQPENALLKNYLTQQHTKVGWSKIA